jgi:U3 small nucleolar RNA-associated protein 13
MVATGSGDKTIKVWSLSDYSCLLTFEGHTNSVLKVIWLSPPRISSTDQDVSSRGAAQVHSLIASAGADGLVKIWSPYSGEIETTLDNHTDRVWALATPYLPCSTSESDSAERNTEFSLISGAADATVTFWIDTTSTSLSAAITASTARIEQDQQLQNYIHAGAYREAITLALQLNHPARLLSLFQSAVDSSAESPTHDSLTGNPDIDHVLQSLDEENLYMLLLRLRDWNTNARTASVSQRILYALFKSYPPSTFMELASRRNPMPGRKSSPASGLKDILHALAAYTERHYKRVEQLVDESYLLEWVLGEMDGISGVNGTNEESNDVVMLGT